MIVSSSFTNQFATIFRLGMTSNSYKPIDYWERGWLARCFHSRFVRTTAGESPAVSVHASCETTAGETPAVSVHASCETTAGEMPALPVEVRTAIYRIALHLQPKAVACLR